VFAASILLLHIARFRSFNSCGWVEVNMKVVEMAVEILEAMDESVVAKRAAELINQSLSVIKTPILPSNAVESSDGFAESPPDLFKSQSFEQGLTDTVCIFPSLRKCSNSHLQSLLPQLGFHDYFSQEMADGFSHVNQIT
jgi:hypothetical protein